MMGISPRMDPFKMPSLLTGSQRSQIDKLIRLHHFALIIELLGNKAVPPAMLTQVKTAGLYRKPRPDVLHRSFQFGKASIVTPAVLTMKPKEFSKHLGRVGSSLTVEDAVTLRTIRESFAGYMQNLIETYTKKVDESIAKANQTLVDVLADKTRKELFVELARRKALSKIAKGMRETTLRLANDASRIMITETNNACQLGSAMEIIRKSGMKDPIVFKRPRPDACEDCVKAYMIGKRPRKFRLSTLMANGSNVGKSHADRQPVVESFHPHCSCMLSWLPPGFTFDADGNMVYRGMK